MIITRRQLSLVGLLGGLASCSSSRVEPRPVEEEKSMEMPLWPDRRMPSLTLRFPGTSAGKAAPRPAIVVLRGGAYATSSGSGAGSAAWLAAHGIVSTEVPYRTRSSGDAHPASYADAARAVRLLRSRAAELNIDPGRIGVLGYSAGGHLASLLSTQPSLYVDPSDDLASRVSARPDLLMLAYPLVSFVEQYSPGAFAGSVESFFGGSVNEQRRRDFSNELHVERTHPPTFVWTTRDDSLVPFTHSTLFAEACQRAKVPVRLELFPHGRHGLGLALEEPDENESARNWTRLLLAWLEEQGAFRDRTGPASLPNRP